MSDIETRQIERLKTLFEAQKTAFANAPIRSIAERQADLRKIEDLARTHADAFAAAISEDFGGRSAAETKVAEMAVVVMEAKHARKNVARWARARSAPVGLNMKPANAYVRRDPKGVVGVISPWNYPVNLALAPIVAALAAGCRVLLKPSELTPRTSQLLHECLSEAFDDNHVAVVQGGQAVGEAFSATPFDHLFYTGSTQVGRIVAQAAAANLTPLTLELGGKSPVIVLPDYPINDLAATLAWGKYMNAGQTCVAPDYVLAPRSQARAIGEAVLAAAAVQHPAPETSPDYTAIAADRHYERLTALVDETRAAGAEVVSTPHDAAAAAAARKIAPTVVYDPPLDGRLMREEIFGPILPIISYDSLEEAVSLVNERERPLALYVYAKSRGAARAVLDATLSGGACVNATMLHLGVEELPFGGVGASGQGAYHGEAGFLTFTHQRSVLEAPRWHPSRLLAPPHGKLHKMITDHLLRG